MRAHSQQAQSGGRSIGCRVYSASKRHDWSRPITRVTLGCRGSLL